ncbi:MAG: ribonuclease HI [Desulfocapsaceae bacterium]|jgi:ribonuclease HI|nr:ribonuclease HI [Desulfocapsaceae bacterium]
MTGLNNDLPQVALYTDGACSPNPGPGGWGALYVYGDRDPLEMSGYGGVTTNNRMELTAVVSALSSLDCSHRITIYTDSQYVKNGITSWIHVWQKNDWKTADKKPVKNVDLWKALLTESGKHEITWKWVRGHALNKWNERADELAVAARKAEPRSFSDNGAAEKPQDNNNTIHLFTGVTCKHSTGEGGWAVILCWRKHLKVIGGRENGLTANQLYIKAVIEGLSGLTKQFPVEVHTYSGYLRDGAATWLAGWKKRNWLTRDGKAVSNKTEWQQLARLLDSHEVHFILDDRDKPLCHMLEAKVLAKEFEGTP